MRLEPIRILALLAITTIASTASAAVDCSKPVGDLDTINNILEGTQVLGGTLYWHGLAGDLGTYRLEFGGFRWNELHGRQEATWEIWVRYPDGKYLVASGLGADESFNALEGVCGEAWANQYAPHIVMSPRATGRAVQSFDAADFNNDGSPDVVDFTPSGVRIQLRDAAGAVTSTTVFPTSFQPELGFSKIMAADFNGDGIPDVAVTLYGDGPSSPGKVAVLLGRGDGTLGPPTVATLAGYVQTIAAGDFNGDGKTDLAVGTDSPRSVLILAGQGDGSFAAPVSYPLTARAASMVAVDLNGDGSLDLAVTGDTGVNALLNLGGGQFGKPITRALPFRSDYLAVTDLNNDGKPDLVVACQSSNAVLTLMGNGNGEFQPPVSYVAGNYPASLALLAMNDGSTMIFSPDSLSGQGLGMRLNDQGVAGAPRYRFIGGSPSDVTTAALNDDGQPDVLVANGKLVAIVSQPDGSFAAPVSYPTSSSATAVASGDLNNDGRQDAVTAGGSEVNVLLGNGDGTLQAPTSTTVNRNARGIVLADFNQDGKLDVAVASYGAPFTEDAGGINILLGKGDGSFLPPLTLTASGMRPIAVQAGDFDGDGRPDVVALVGSPDGATLTLAFFAGNGDGTFAAAGTVQLTRRFSDTGKLTAGDVNGDGILDLAYATNLQLGLLIGDGTGGFREATPQPSTDGGATGVAITDLDGDGNLDLVVTHCCGETDGTYLLGNGDGSFRVQQHFPSGSSPRAVTTIRTRSNLLPGLVVVATGEPGAYSFTDPDASGTVVLLGPLFPDPQSQPDGTAPSRR